MKKNDSENVCVWEVWSAETLNIPRNSGGSIPNIWVQWDHHALFRWETSTQMSKHQASKCPPGLVPLPSLWTGPSHNSRCQREQLQHAGEGGEEFFVTSPGKKYTRSKIRLVAGVEKMFKYVQTYIINGHERWCICLCGNDHHEEKLANGHMAPLCGTSGSHSAAGIVSVSSIQWLGDLANEFAMVSSI